MIKTNIDNDNWWPKQRKFIFESVDETKNIISEYTFSFSILLLSQSDTKKKLNP